MVVIYFKWLFLGRIFYEKFNVVFLFFKENVYILNKYDGFFKKLGFFRVFYKIVFF